MEIKVKRGKAKPPAPQKAAAPLPPGNRLGEWGRVDASNSEDNTIDITLESGVHLTRVPMASREWVIPGEDAGRERDSGERDLPPPHARVFILMPTFRYEDCFALPFSGHSTIDQPEPFMGEDLEETKERVTPSGWRVTDNHSTGSHRSASPDGKTVLEIDYGTGGEPRDKAALHLSIFENAEVDVAEDGSVTARMFDTVMKVRQGSCEISAGGDFTLNARGKVVITGRTIDFN